MEDVPELDVPGVPYAPLLPLLPVLPEVPLLLVPLPGVMPEEPLLPLSIPLEPSPLEPEEEPEDVPPLLGEVPADCPNVAVAAPTSDRKMARGNFFIFAPFALGNFQELRKSVFRLEFAHRFSIFVHAIGHIASQHLGEMPRARYSNYSLKKRRSRPAPESLIFCEATRLARAGDTRCFNF